MLNEDQIRNLLVKAGDTVAVEPVAPTVTALPPRRWRTIGAGIAAAATLAGIAGVGLWLAGDDGGEDRTGTTILGGVPEGTVPSVFAHTRASATEMLERLELEVEFRDEVSCEPAGRPIGTEPATGTPFDPGDTVTVLVAYQAANTDCISDRHEPWAFVDFATGRGPAPRFAEAVQLFVDGELVTTMPGDTAAEGVWPRPSALTELATASAQVLGNDDGYLTPTLQVQEGTPPDEVCAGVRRPPVLGSREAMTITIDIPVDGIFHCPARVSLYRTDGRIDAVATWTERALTEAPEAPAMPDVVGMTVEDARNTLTAAGYTVRVEELETCEPREGIVVEQAPGQTPAFDQDIDPDADYRGVVVTLVVEVDDTGRDCGQLRQAALALKAFADGGPVPPVADEVELFVGYRHDRTLTGTGAANILDPASDPEQWVVCAPETGISCPVSILELLAGSGIRTTTDMPDLPCVDDLGGLPSRLSPDEWLIVVPREQGNCATGQWALQLWVDANGAIRAVNLMLGSP